MNATAPGPRVVALGDSVTLGIGDGIHASAGNDGWAAHVAAAIGAASFTNLAANGVRARDMLHNQVPQAIALAPDVVLMSVGGSDVLRGDFDPNEIHDHVRATALWLREAGITVVFATLTAIPLFESFPQRVTTVMARRIHRTNAALVAALDGTGVMILDGAIVMALVGKSGWHIDRIHPSPTGHRAIAERALGLLDQYPATNAIPPAEAPPNSVATAWWLVRNGLPWAVKRSRDLLPQIAAVIRDELRAERLVERAAIRALRDERGRVIAPSGGAFDSANTEGRVG